MKRVLIGGCFTVLSLVIISCGKGDKEDPKIEASCKAMRVAAVFEAQLPGQPSFLIQVKRIEVKKDSFMENAFRVARVEEEPATEQDKKDKKRRFKETESGIAFEVDGRSYPLLTLSSKNNQCTFNWYDPSVNQFKSQFVKWSKDGSYRLADAEDAKEENQSLLKHIYADEKDNKPVAQPEKQLPPPNRPLPPTRQS